MISIADGSSARTGAGPSSHATAANARTAKHAPSIVTHRLMPARVYGRLGTVKLRKIFVKPASPSRRLVFAQGRSLRHQGRDAVLRQPVLKLRDDAVVACKLGELRLAVPVAEKATP